MKKTLRNITLAITLFITVTAFSQQNLFSKVYYYAGYGMQGYAVTQAYDNGFMVVGDYDYKAFVMKIDSAGNYLWGKSMGSNYNNSFTCITKTHDSCFVIGGRLDNLTYYEAVCVKINQMGDTLWAQKNGTSDLFFSVEQTFDHGFVFGGYTENSSAPYTSIIVVKVDSLGNLEWRSKLSPGNNSNRCNAVKQLPDSTFVISGYTENYPPFDMNAVLINLSASGNVLWAKKYNHPIAQSTMGMDLNVTPTSIVNYFQNNSSKIIMKTDFAGNIIWQKAINDGGIINSYGNYPSAKIHSTFDGGFLLPSSGDWSTSLTKVDSMGNVVWTDQFYLKEQDAIETKDSGYLALGNGPLIGVEPRLTFDPQIGIVKIDSLGLGGVWSCMNTGFGSIGTDSLYATPFAVTSLLGGSNMRIYPVVNSSLVTVDSGCVSMTGDVAKNIFNYEINISPNPTSGLFQVWSATSDIKEVVIYDLLGNKILKINSELKKEKVKSIDLSGVSKGIYFAKIILENGIENKKIIVE